MPLFETPSTTYTSVNGYNCLIQVYAQLLEVILSCSLLALCQLKDILYALGWQTKDRTHDVLIGFWVGSLEVVKNTHAKPLFSYCISRYHRAVVVQRIANLCFGPRHCCKCCRGLPCIEIDHAIESL